MSSLGTFVLLATFVVSCYAAMACIVGARRRSSAVVESGIGAYYLTTALMTAASAIIVHAFVTGNFLIKYVDRYSDTAQPLFYKLTSYWGGLDGSIMFWVFLLSVFGAIAVRGNRESHRELIPYVVATLSFVQMFFLFLMVVHNNPFETYLTSVPQDGRGLNPLLQNPYMVIHPPSLYIGFVGMTIPYAFGMAALVTGYLDDSWLRAVRRWTMVSWWFLTFGLVLGMIWAYEELGWGGYWGWDPVENAGLLPWFTATAFLHSVMVQERRGMLKVWNVTLVIVTFFLTIFGTFMTRSGIVQSVHAFGEDRALAWMFTVFMVVILTVSFGYVIYRLPLLKARHDLDSWASREAAFLANNWVLLFSALFVLFATMFPTLSEAIMGERLTVGPPFFNKWMLPIGLILLVLTGIGPLMAWRKSTLSNLRYQFLWPVLTGVVTFAVLYGLGARVLTSGICFALSGFVMATVTQELWRGARVRQGATNSDVFTALIGLVSRNHRRYGGYVVHVGIVMMFLGFAGEGYKLEEQVLLKPGQQVELGGFVVKHEAMKLTDDGQKQMVTAHVAVTREGTAVGTMAPAKWYFRKYEEEPTTEVAIRRAFWEDLYIVLAAFDMQDQSATLHVVVNPLVNWIWLGFGVLALGTLIALLPERSFAFAAAKVPSGATTATMLALLLALPAVGAAQHIETPQSLASVVIQRTPLERELGRELICMCGTCGRKLVGECSCGYAANMRQEIAGLVNQGKTREQVVQFYINKYGSQEPLAAPIDEGFNRLAWLFPYMVGGMSAVAVGVLALRWSRREPAAPTTHAHSASGTNPALEEQLDDELRNLD